jgi:hypothetical protein
MTFDAATTSQFRANYAALTGESAEGLICPITLQDTPFDELCAGHILNQGLRRTSRVTVPQRRDLDNYFGASIEADLVKYLNFPVLTSSEHLAQVKRFTIRLATGERVEAFFAGPEAEDRFKRVSILNADGKVIASPYIRSSNAEAGHYQNIEVEWTTTINDLAVVGALIKSTYLTLFRLVGYRYALDAIGSIVRRCLNDFFNDRATKLNARDYFSRFHGAVITSLKGFLNDAPDTLSGRTLLFHYVDGSRQNSLFAISCLFQINGCTLIVTLPASMDVCYSLDALRHYEGLLRDRSMRHDIHFVTFTENKFEVSPKPMDLRYVESFAAS